MMLRSWPGYRLGLGLVDGVGGTVQAAVNQGSGPVCSARVGQPLALKAETSAISCIEKNQHAALV